MPGNYALLKLIWEVIDNNLINIGILFFVIFMIKLLDYFGFTGFKWLESLAAI